MASKRRDFKRQIGERRYRKMFVIAAEGTNSEPQYFALFDSKNIIHVHCLKGTIKSAPPYVLDRMKQHIDKMGLEKTDEAWLVVDKDNWTDTQLMELYCWSQLKSNYGFALSNPDFEYWLLLHFEDGNGVGSPRDCYDRLRRFLPDYYKDIDTRKITPECINEAIRRAKLRDNPPCSDWPRTLGSTTVYKLVEKLINT